MNECKECELAIYCFSDPNTWVFRTKQEMEEKQAAMGACPVLSQVQELRAQSVPSQGSQGVPSAGS